VVCTDAIEHIFDTNGFFFFCHSVLKKGGYLLITTPNISFIGNRIYSELRGGVPLSANNHHITFWNYKSLFIYMLSYGFTDIHDESRYYPERYTTGRLRYLIGQRLRKMLEKAYDFSGRYQGTSWLKSFVTNELLVIAKKTEEITFSLPLTFLDLDSMPKEKLGELLKRCAIMNDKRALKQHPGAYELFLKLGKQLKSGKDNRD
jgi:hypothetical protein